MNAAWRKRWIWRPAAWLRLALVALVGWHVAAPAEWGWLSTGQVWGLIGVMLLLYLIQAKIPAEEEET